MADRALLWQAFDALYPSGAFTLSQGLETYVRLGAVRDEESLAGYLRARLSVLPFQDLGAAALAAAGEDPAVLDAACSAMKGPAQTREGSSRMAKSFLRSWPEPDLRNLRRYSGLIKNGACDGHWCVAAGCLIRDAGGDIQQGLELFAYSLLSMGANHAVKLVPLSQGSGQRALRGAARGIEAAVTAAMGITVGDLGVSGVGFSLREAQHETLPARLYSS